VIDIPLDFSNKFFVGPGKISVLKGPSDNPSHN